METARVNILLLVLFSIIILVVNSYELQQPLAQTVYGQVRGSIQFSRSGREYTSYRGIPYAKPPIGNLRFKAPQRPENWSFPIDATKEGPYCIQKNYFFANPKVEGQEDCLYLNIYVPKTNRVELLPVMVFIHWGGFLAGRGTSDYIGPEYFMDRDVILVTFNYRLGVLGFLSTVDDAAPGNYGLKDQVLALKFVQENIEFFGGNKNRVTIFGQSAGSGSVSLHLISPSSKGLFQQAITQSGVALDVWAKPLNILQPNVTAAQASFVNCGEYVGNNSRLIECLRSVDAESLVNSSSNFKTFHVDPLTPFSVVTESKTESNPDPFITKEPLEYLQEGDFQKVPWIVGVVQDEGILKVSQFVRQNDILTDLNGNFETVIPELLGFPLSVGFNTSSLFKNVSDFYFNGKNSIDVNDATSIQGLIDLYTDRIFAYGVYQTVILQSMKHHQPIWLYNFDYRGEHTYGDLFAGTKNDVNFDWGVSHCDDLIYLFNSPSLIPPLKAESDICMSHDLLTLWTNFATYGNPDPNNDLKWQSLNFSSDTDIKNEDILFLNISGSYKDKANFHIDRSFLPDRMKFWATQNLAENFPGLLETL